jgi:hypothetical protein
VVCYHVSDKSGCAVGEKMLQNIDLEHGMTRLIMYC